MFLSAVWSGRGLDKQIIIDSGFFDKISMGRCIFGRQGVYFQKIVGFFWSTLKVSHFIKGKIQLSWKQVDTSRQLSSVIIHVERVIGQVKKFPMLQNSNPV